MIKIYFTLLILLSSSFSHAYWSCAWPYRTQISVQESSGSALTDYQIKIEISGPNLNSSYDWTSDGFDLRIVDSDDLTQLDHWVENWDQAGETATIWVKLDSLLANENKTLYIYYGNEFADPLANIPFTFIEPGIKFHTRNSSANPNNLTEAFNIFNGIADGDPDYGCTFITNFTGINNRNTFGEDSDFIAYSETFFEVQSDETGVWGIRYGADFGGGGGLYVDGTPLEEDWGNDLWWSNNWNNSDVLQGTIELTEGYHKLEVIGAEGCCDGGITVQFQRPGEGWTTYSVSNIDIRSRACPISDPTVTFGAQSTASCPTPLANYRLDEGGWSGVGDVIDQTGSFPGTMLGTVNEIEDTQVCGGAEVIANNQGADVSAIQTGLDLDADVGSVGSFAFWVNLNNNWNDGSARKIMDASYLPTGASSEKYFYLDKLSGGNFDFRFEDSADGDFTLQEPTGANRLANQWYHITVTFDFPNSDFKIYVDETLVSGALVNTNGNPPITSGAVIDLNTIQFGDKIPSPSKGGTGRSADGTFDEINIFNSVLSISEIRGLMAKTRNCPTESKTCEAVFPDGLVATNNGSIDFGFDAQLLNNPDNQLSAGSITMNGAPNQFTCGGTSVCVSGSPSVTPVSAGAFQTSASTTDVNVGFRASETVGVSTNAYRNINTGFRANLTFSSVNHSEFFIDTLSIGGRNVVSLSPGTYWINNLSIGNRSEFVISGSGPVRLYINNVNSWNSDVIINSPSSGNSGSPESLLLYFYDTDVTLGNSATISGAVYSEGDITFSSDGYIFGLLAANNIDLASNSQITYDETTYDGLSDVSWCGSASADIGSITLSAPATGINCLPSEISISILDTNGDLMEDYDDDIALSTDVLHGDWSKQASALGVINNGAADDGAATYAMSSDDDGTAQLLISNTHAESTIVTVASQGVSETATINFQPAGFVFSNIPAQVSGQTSGLITLSAVETDLVTGACQALLVNNQTIEMAVECISPGVCGSATDSIGSDSLGTNASGSVTSYGDVTLNFGDTTSYTSSFTNTYSDAGSIRLWARYELQNESGVGTGNYISGGSNNFVNVPAGFCIEPTESNWECSTPGLTANCSAFKQAGDTFNLSVTAKQANGVSTDYCSHNTTTNFSGIVNLSHSLVAPTSLNGGDAGTFSLTSATLTSGTVNVASSFSEMGAFTISAGGNGYLSETLPINTSDNIGRFYPAYFNVVSTTSAVYSNGNTGFTYTGQLESDGITGAISYVTPPELIFDVRGASNQLLKNYLTPFYSEPVATVTAASATTGLLVPAQVLTVTADTSNGVTSSPDINNQYTYTFNASDHFVFNRNGNSLRSPFNNDIALTVTSFIEPVDSVDINSSSTISGSGGPIYYGRVRIENAYGPETEPVPQIFKAEYFDGTAFTFNPLDNGTSYDLSNVNTITVTDTGDPVNNLTSTDSAISGAISDTGLFSSGLFNTNWSVPSSNRYGSYHFLYTVENWLKYDWNGSGDEDPSGVVNFGQYKGNDRIIYWKEINH